MALQKVLIVNQGISANNLGDYAIRESMGHLFSDLKYEASFAFFSNPLFSYSKPKNTSESISSKRKNVVLRHVKQYLRFFFWPYKYFRKIKSELLKNDYAKIVIGGGQLVNSLSFNAPHTFAIAMFWWVYFSVRYTSANIYIVGVGVEGGFNFMERLLYKWSFKKASNICVRDSFSKDKISSELGFESHLMPDVAFYVSGTKNLEEAMVDRNIALVNVYNYNTFCSKYNSIGLSESEYYQGWYDVVQNYKGKGLSVMLFSTTLEDELENRKFIKYVKDKWMVSLNSIETSDVATLYKLYSESYIVYSGRMHALLLALKHGCKVEPYILSNKLKSFNDEYVKGDRSLEELSYEVYNTMKLIGL